MQVCFVMYWIILGLQREFIKYAKRIYWMGRRLFEWYSFETFSFNTTESPFLLCYF